MPGKYKDPEYMKKWRKKNRDYPKEWYYLNQERAKENARNCYQRHKVKYNGNSRDRQIFCKDSWVGYIPEESNCEICGKKLFFRNHHIRDTIHFDHRKEDCVIKINPANWLMSRFRTPDNQKIWENADFGILCHWCNLWLPTKNRKEWLRKVAMYVNKS